ncbi:MAG: AEC family transporter [Acidimicrobiales bacterium]|nr:AEC family transporter [Acidimicrobiales bacterium]
MANVIFDVLAPVAILVGLGAALGPRLHIDVGGLSRLAYNVFGPAFIFAVLAGADLERGVVARLVLAGLAGMASAVALAVLWSRITGAGYELTAATAITSSYGNVGNAGLAIVAFSLGDQALPVAGVLMLTINLTGLVLSVGLAEARSRSPLPALGKALATPMAIAGAISLLVNLSGVDLPVVVDRSIGLLADALIPVMLLTLGMQLAKSGRPTWSNDLGVVLVAKLALAPLVAGLAASALSLGGDFLDAVVIQSAMPPAVFAAVIAIESDLAPDRVTAAVVLTTLLSALTLPVVLLVL